MQRMSKIVLLMLVVLSKVIAKSARRVSCASNLASLWPLFHLSSQSGCCDSLLNSVGVFPYKPSTPLL
jgi:hypothetical protein